ncbi:hypothetical protein D9M71_444360 [compost metagenome]
MQLCRKQLTAVHCLVGVVGHAALRDAFPPACRQRVPAEDCRRRKADDGAIASRRGVIVALPGNTLAQPAFKGIARGIADIETTTVGTVFPAPVPTDQGICVSGVIELALAHIRVCQAQRHAGVISPLTRNEVERATPDHVAHLPPVAGLELERGADRIADGQAKQRALGAVQCLLRGQCAGPGVQPAWLDRRRRQCIRLQGGVHPLMQLPGGLRRQMRITLHVVGQQCV